MEEFTTDGKFTNQKGIDIPAPILTEISLTALITQNKMAYDEAAKAIQVRKLNNLL